MTIEDGAEKLHVSTTLTNGADKRKNFSITLDGVETNYDALNVIGVNKLAEAREVNAKEYKERGLLAFVAAAVGISLLVTDAESSVAQVLGGMNLAMSFSTLIKAAVHKQAARELDQAVAMVTGDAHAGRYKSTADELVKKGFAQKGQIGNDKTYTLV